jgi:hypothetical protein
MRAMDKIWFVYRPQTKGILVSSEISHNFGHKKLQQHV